MRRAAEIAAFLGLSAAVHAGVVAGLGDSLGGPQGQGAGGADRVTLQAAPDSLAALADRWTDAPEAAMTPVALPAPTLSDTQPAPHADSAVARVAPPLPPPMAAIPTPPAAQEPAPRLSRPALPSLAPALAQPTPEAVPDAPAQADTPPALRAPPPLVTPQTTADPEVASAAPPPPVTTDLAAATSPRPPQRPFQAPPRPADPPRASAAPSTPQPARIATGAGGGATQGATAAPTPAPTAISAAQRQSLMAQWGGQIMARIERARPRVRGAGQVVLALQVARSGQLAGLSVAQSSGDPALDEAALSAVRRAGRFPAAPEGLTEAAYAFSLPIRFR